MDRRIEQIIAGLQKLLKGTEESFIAKVIEDSGDLVNVEDMNEVEYREVRKIATQGVSGILFKLKAGSYVIVSRISGSDELFVSMMSEIEGVDIASGQTRIKIGSDETITLNEGYNNGLVKVAEMVNWMNKVYTDLQALTGLLASIPVMAGGVPVGTGSVVFTPATPAAVQDTFENTKVKH